MKITCQDFLNKPYMHGWKYCKQINKATSLKQRVTKIALTILLWIPIVNVVVHFVLRRFTRVSEAKKGGAVTTDNPLLKRPPHLSPMSAIEKAQYADHSTEPNQAIGTWDDLAKTANFGNNYERVALMRVNDRQGSSKDYDLRLVYSNSENNSKLYCPFEILERNKQTFFSFGANGWLKLSPSIEAMYIRRIDSFTTINPLRKTRLGSALVQFAIEMSLKAGYGGKVALTSTNGTFGFYYKLGFICKNPEVHNRILEKYHNSPVSDEAGEMYLPPESIAIWKQKIAETPILS